MVGCVRKETNTKQRHDFYGQLFHLQRIDTSLLKSTCTIPRCETITGNDRMNLVHFKTKFCCVFVPDVWTLRFSNTIFKRRRVCDVERKSVFIKERHIPEQIPFILASGSCQFISLLTLCFSATSI
ncbi:unnamed protein product [Albugo candida]|uniref:Uncharacterized protein n=1 Tax=Albugo candida TaxID=65357 RepID=A0A024FVQ3_9STRA|nr:unnamed protein product [Albugo candida]|eukprot:CCI11106.1 unnamed protein product [Albugo candida]